MIHPFSIKIHTDPMDMLWHYANGEMPCYLVREGGEVGWIKYTHRGVQYLDKVDFPRKQKRYIFSPRFQIKYNTAFPEVLAGCADLSREGRTWITPELVTGYTDLHRLGYAHSYEAWTDGQLVGGAIGVQIGGYITCETMYHRVSNASKAVWGQTLVRLQERGFKWIDTNCVAAHHVEYGEEWVQQWKFEQMLKEAMSEEHSLADDIPCPPVPWALKAGLPVAKILSSVRRRLPFFKPQQQGVVRPTVSHTPERIPEPTPQEPVTAALP